MRNYTLLALFSMIFTLTALTGCQDTVCLGDCDSNAPDDPGTEEPPCDPCDNPDVPVGNDVDGDAIDDAEDNIIFCTNEAGVPFMSLSGSMTAGNEDLAWHLVGDPSPLTSGDWWNGTTDLLWTDNQAFLVVALENGSYNRITGMAYDESDNAHWLQYAWVCNSSSEPACVLNSNDSYALGGFTVSGSSIRYAGESDYVALGACPW